MMDKRQEDAFWATIEILNQSRTLPHIMVIGSWAEYLYSFYYESKFLPVIRTRDVDFLYRNIRRPSPQINLEQIMTKAGFVIIRDRLTEVVKMLKEDLLEVRHADFSELSDNQKYDGIWACASLLHVPKAEMPAILDHVRTALKMHGIFYISVKQGKFDDLRNGRHFLDYEKEEFTSLLRSKNLEIIEQWISEDVRPDRSEHWINLVARRA